MNLYKTIHFKEIDSTNKYLKEYHQELENFTFVSTDYQNKGKGRNDRLWTSTRGENLLFSLLLKDEKYIKLGGLLSLIASISVSKILEEKYHLKDVQIKWPNDVYVNDKKICGILLGGQYPSYIVIGVGLNVNQIEFKGDYRKTPTSIALELGKKIDISALKEPLYVALLENITTEKDYIDYFNKHNYLLNKMVEVRIDNKEIVGKVVSVDNEYNLLIEFDNKIIKIISGEIKVL